MFIQALESTLKGFVRKIEPKDKWLKQNPLFGLNKHFFKNNNNNKSSWCPCAQFPLIILVC